MSFNPVHLGGSPSTVGVSSSTVPAVSQGVNGTAVQGMFNTGMTSVLSNHNPQKMATIGQVAGAGLLVLGILSCCTGAGSSVGVPLMIAGGVILGISLATSFSTNLLEEVQKQNPQNPQWGRTILIATLKTLSTGLANSLAGGMTVAPMALGPSAAAASSLGLGSVAGRQVFRRQFHSEEPRLHPASLQTLEHFSRETLLEGDGDVSQSTPTKTAKTPKKSRKISQLPDLPEGLQRGLPINAAALPVFQKLTQRMSSENE